MAVSPGRFAVADVGSNTVHLLTAKSDGQRIWPLHEETARLQLAADVAREGAISAAKLDAALQTVERFVRRTKKLDTAELRLLGTHPVRRAANADKLAQAILRETGVRLQTLSPEGEALLGYLGTTIDYPGLVPTLVVDVGGGSTQVSIVDKTGRFTFTTSVPVGTMNLPVMYLRNDPPHKQEIRQLQRAIDEAVKPLVKQLPDAATGLDRGVLIGGLARRLRRAGRFPASATISLGWLERAQAATMVVSADGLAALGAARKDDASLLRTGSTILASVMRTCDIYSFALSHYGLREGAVLTLARGEDLPGTT